MTVAVHVAIRRTGLLGGFPVTLGLVALVVVTGALAGVMPEPTAHVLGSLTFGVGFGARFVFVGPNTPLTGPAHVVQAAPPATTTTSTSGLPAA